MALRDLLFHVLIPRIYDVIIMMSLLSSVCSVVYIPSKVSDQAKKLVYYDNQGTWYEADRVCRSTGGYLVLIDGPDIVEKLKKLQEKYNFEKFWTRMVRQDDGEFYSQDDACSPISKTSWSWKDRDDATKPDEQCVFVGDGNDFSWSTEKCDNGRKFMCEHDTNGTCSFEMTSVSLASLPVSNASMAVCQAKCRQMIGCFATAPSGHATLPPFTHCLFVVTGDDSNPMAANDCPYEYEEVKEFLRPPSGDPDRDPVDCVPGNTNRSSVIGQRSLSEFVQEFNNRTHILITPSPVVETAYVTLLPNIVTDYVTLTPDTEFAYVTLTPDLVTAYVTLMPSTINEVVRTTVQEMVTTTVEQVMTSVLRKMTTTTLTTLVGQSCRQSKVTTAASKAIMLSPALTQTVTLTQTHVVDETESHVVNVTETNKVTQTQTQVVTQTTTATATVAMNPTTCVQSSSSVLPDISPPLSNSSGNNTSNNGNNGNNGQNTIDDSGSHEISGNDNNIIIIDNCGNSSSPNMTKTEKELEEELEALIKELKVNPVNVSRSRRKKESAPDERKSAQSLGAVAVGVMVVGVVLLVLVDGSTLFCYIHRLVKVRHDENI